MLAGDDVWGMWYVWVVFGGSEWPGMCVDLVVDGVVVVVHMFWMVEVRIRYLGFGMLPLCVVAGCPWLLWVCIGFLQPVWFWRWPWVGMGCYGLGCVVVVVESHKRWALEQFLRQVWRSGMVWYLFQLIVGLGGVWFGGGGLD